MNAQSELFAVDELPKPRRQSLRLRVFAALTEASTSGRTAEELAAVTRIPVHVVCARLVELRRQNHAFTVDNHRRATRSGRLAMVWFTTNCDEDCTGCEWCDPFDSEQL